MPPRGQDQVREGSAQLFSALDRKAWTWTCATLASDRASPGLCLPLARRGLASGLALLAVAGWGWGCAGQSDVEGEPVPELLAVKGDQATVGWRSSVPRVGAVLWQAAADEGAPRQAVEPWGKTEEHEVTLQGLQPGRSYRYRLAEGRRLYTFRTRPAAETPFSLLLVWGDVAGHLPRLRDEPAELLVSLTPLAAAGPADPLRQLRPSLPIFDVEGPSSPLLRARGELSAQGGKGWSLDWGGLRLAFLRELELGELPRLLDAPAAHSQGLVLAARLIAGRRREPLHAALLAHNLRSPQRPAAFVLVVGDSGEPEERDGIRYLPLAGPTSPAGVLRLDVEPESVRAVEPPAGQPRELRSPPLPSQRSCEECRRLADQGRYEESLTAYRQFIATHGGHYQVDDALLAIAEILDQRLFRLAEGVEAYRVLLERYPASSLALLARHRLGYLLEHADCGWEPLARFERIRLRELPLAGSDPAARQAPLQQVEELLAAHPSCAIAPRLLSWQASQLRSTDPDRAVERYRLLASSYPAHPLAREVPVEIAGTYYEAKRFAEAVPAYGEAIRLRGDLAGELGAELVRAERNLRRRHLAVLAWALLALLALPALAALAASARPGRVGAPGELARTLRGGAGAFALLAALLLLGGWLIAEQFWSPGERYALALASAASAALGGIVGRGLAWGVLLLRCRAAGAMGALGPPGAAGAAGTRRSEGGAALLLVGSLLGLLFLVAGVFLAIFHVNEHYLVVVGL
ncbi:MAG: tetratricopeptide repeat protein [Deltaproteobacteria bacterium]|nr:tetratricopeptide repeat protein [Deltaproteobacteria bacterium]